MKDFKVAEEVAVGEVKEFIEYHLDEEIEADQVSKDYKEMVKAVMRGNLNLEDKDAPSLILLKPIKFESGAIDTGEVKFLTRVTKSQLAAMAKGMDLQKDALSFANKITAYIIQQPSVPMLDKYGKGDIKIIDQMVGLFQ